MRIMDWVGVDESTPVRRPPVGGYVARIVEVEDVPGRQYLNVVYDIAEGEWRDFYADDFGRRNTWAHSFVRSYKDTALGMFKAFLSRLEESNPGFSIAEWQRTGDESALVGLLVGIVLQYEDYTNDQGEDKERLKVMGVENVQAIRAGTYRVPARRDRRGETSDRATAPAAKAAPAQAPAYAQPSYAAQGARASYVPAQPARTAAAPAPVRPVASPYDDIPFK